MLHIKGKSTATGGSSTHCRRLMRLGLKSYYCTVQTARRKDHRVAITTVGGRSKHQRIGKRLD